jgi:hypothetical protein
MTHGTFVTAINCMDGRVQQPILDWMIRHFDADYVDTITEPGPDGILAGSNAETIASIRRRVEVSTRAHGSRVVALVAHDDCAGNPVSKEEHLAQLDRAIAVIQSWRLPGRIISLWVDQNWQVERLSDTGT